MVDLTVIRKYKMIKHEVDKKIFIVKHYSKYKPSTIDMPRSVKEY